MDVVDKGYKRQITITLYETELDVIDSLRDRLKCSRAAVVGAWCDEKREYENTDLTGKVKAGRRPGGGRKPWKEKTA